MLLTVIGLLLGAAVTGGTLHQYAARSFGGKELLSSARITQIHNSEAATAPPPCQADQLKADLRPAAKGAGAALFVVELQNVSMASCSMTGYPSYVDLGPNQRHTPAAHVPGSVATVSVVPDGVASFYVYLSNACEHANPPRFEDDAVDITPPGATAALTVTLPSGSFCAGADHAVSPIAAGLRSQFPSAGSGCSVLAGPRVQPGASSVSVSPALQQKYAEEKAAVMQKAGSRERCEAGAVQGGGNRCEPVPVGCIRSDDG